MMLRTTLLATAASMIAFGAQAADLRLMTGPQGGVWVPLGGQLKELWEKAIPGTNVQPLPGAGIANVRGIDEGKADVGFGNSISTVDGLAGNAPFPKPQTNVCNVASLYPQYFQMLVPADSGIEKVTDLKGKSITTQPRGNTGELITQQLLKAHGMSYSDVKVSYVSYTDSVEQMKDGHAQAFTLGTAIPSGAVMDLASARDVKLLDLSGSLPEMKKMNPGYTLVTVPKNTYPKQDKDVQVIGYATHLVASCSLPEEMVYKMTKAVADNIPSLAATSKAISGLTPKGMAEDIGVPFHPGAAKFYQEQGIAVKAKNS
ncbi:TAXI family TRAP transporter solute-binding subunit [Microvirga makkahensis]|uniref:TAXI family TRAP transporter solute-binding subunit n=1 Tax=Microvirga makkahensis TaxID=1128670 RepID=A0A7X3MVM1_9HYPH|nr:TAXI family TRAP transporter solute-binding subunit [Microvirga makkahensis]MXQ14039.1 TAXI family TRAP transporter solute-binding subunit [Microvirga makkahensis]